MTYGEMKKIVLQKVFAISDGRVVSDDTTQEYLTAIPGAANEGLMLLATAGRFVKRDLVIFHVKELPSEDEREEGAVYRETGVGSQAYDMARLCQDFYALDSDGVYWESLDGGEHRQSGAWALEAGHVLLLPANQSGRWTVYYNAYPEAITDETEDTYEIPVAPEVATLLPLYIASQVYKDDDVALAAQYRNEFEVGREALLSSAASAGWRQGGGQWHSDRGWFGYS